MTALQKLLYFLVIFPLLVTVSNHKLNNFKLQNSIYTIFY
jgi:hypothetical protein